MAGALAFPWNRVLLSVRRVFQRGWPSATPAVFVFPKMFLSYCEMLRGPCPDILRELVPWFLLVVRNWDGPESQAFCCISQWFCVVVVVFIVVAFTAVAAAKLPTSTQSWR